MQTALLHLKVVSLLHRIPCSEPMELKFSRKTIYSFRYHPYATVPCQSDIMQTYQQWYPTKTWNLTDGTIRKPNRRSKHSKARLLTSIRYKLRSVNLPIIHLGMMLNTIPRSTTKQSSFQTKEDLPMGLGASSSWSKQGREQTVPPGDSSASEGTGGEIQRRNPNAKNEILIMASEFPDRSREERENLRNRGMFELSRREKAGRKRRKTSAIGAVNCFDISMIHDASGYPCCTWRKV